MKYPRASRALRWALDPTLKRAHFACTTLLRTIGNLGLLRSGAPPDQILDPPLQNVADLLWMVIARHLKLPP